jgi:uncharacterized protein
VTMNPLGGGLIPRNAERLAFLKGDGDRDVVQAALRFNISQPAITVALVGFASKQEVDEGVAAVDHFQPYPPEHIEKIKAQVRTGFDGFCTGCGYCMPCPSNVPVSKLMESYNQRILGGTDADIKERLTGHWGIAPDDAAACVACGDCEQSCTQHLDIRERMKEIAKLAAK